jgi:surface protein
MFSNCSSLTSLDLSNFDTSNATNMSAMFSNCSSLTSLDLSNFDTSKVVTMDYMFSGCLKLTSVSLGQRTTTHTENAGSMFKNITTTGVLKIPSGTSEYWTNVISALPSTWTVQEY